jgi:aconitate hydratase
MAIETDALQRIDAAYSKLRDGVEVARRRIDRPLTLAEKILFGHFTDPVNQPIERGVDHAALQPDRVALQDATAQMALLQFELAGLHRVVVPTTVHCDHLIQARVGADTDLEVAITENEEVYEFLRSAAARYGAGFWRPGSGIIHQVVFENYAFPGGMMIGTDSHTPNAGGMGMIAIGVGGADAVDVMAGLGWGVTMPRLIGVHLTGELDGWTTPKDVILRVADELTVKGGTGAIVEYFGPGLESMSATGRGTVTNMGAEIGATTSLFPFDERTAAYLRSTDRTDIAALAEANAEHLRADDGVVEARHQIFDRVIEIDLSELEPAWVGPHTPDLRNTVAEIRGFMENQDYPLNVTNALIGSCTNSSYEDMGRAAHIARQAAEAGIELQAPLLVTPGSEQIRATTERDGQIEAFESVGATVLANACGPCIGQWKREDLQNEEQNTIVTSFNRNFPGRNDANRNTLAFIGSPELVVATAFAGEIGFDPRNDAIATASGEFRFSPPSGDELPADGFDPGDEGFIAPPEDGSDVEVIVSPESDRLQRLTPFNAWDGSDYTFMSLLLKTQGKTTTDHISPAGSWLRFRGHLENISGNLFSGGVNAFSGETGSTLNQISGQPNVAVSEVARAYKDAGLRWVAVGDENYGEGSSREHASMEIRFSGGYVVIARSFARIAETNLKKQGILALTFSDPAHYDLVGELDRLSVLGLADFAPGRSLTLRIDHEDGSSDEVSVNHTYTEEQITWFRAGSALNKIASSQ